MRSRSNPTLEEFSLVVADLPRARHRHNDCDIHFAVTNVDYSEIAVVIHVHLAHVGHALHLLVVSDECNTAWPDATRFDETEAASDDGAQTIGANDITCPQRAWLSIGHESGDTTHARRSIPGNVCHPHGFLDSRSGGARAAQQDVIEDRPADGEALVAESVEAVIGRKFPFGDVAIRGTNAHPGQMRRIAPLDFIEDPHVRQDSGRLRTQIFRADLVARKSRPVEDEYIDSFLCERPRRGGAGRAAADHYNFRVEVLTHAIRSRGRRAG